MKRSKIYKQLESVDAQVTKTDGECIIIAHDGESEDMMMSVVLHDSDESTGMFMEFFRKFPELIPKAMYAAALAMECDGDCDNCDKCCHDDDEEGEICMN